MHLFAFYSCGVILQFFEMMIKVGIERKTLLNDVLRKGEEVKGLFLAYTNVNSFGSCRNMTKNLFCEITFHESQRKHMFLLFQSNF